VNEHEHRRRIEGWLRAGVALIVPVTVVIGVWLLLFHPKRAPPPPPADGSAHVVAFPAAAGPPAVTLSPAPPTTPATPSQP
jgi:hypothetical protein